MYYPTTIVVISNPSKIYVRIYAICYVSAMDTRPRNIILSRRRAESVCDDRLLRLLSAVYYYSNKKLRSSLHIVFAGFIFFNDATAILSWQLNVSKRPIEM